MSRLNTSDNAVNKALDDVRNGTCDWAVFGYVPKSDCILRVVAAEKGGVEDLKEELNEGKVHFAYLAVESFKTRKFVYIAWCGEGVTGIQKGNFPNHAIDMANFIKKSRTIHVQVNARNEADVEEDDILERVKVAFGSNFDAGKAKQGISEGIKNVKEGKEIHTKAQQKTFKTAAQLAAEEEEVKRRKIQQEKEALQQQLNQEAKQQNAVIKNSDGNEDDGDGEEYGEEYEFIGKVKATQYYVNPDGEDDLAFRVGDVINVIYKDESGWWQGELNGKVGYFPSNFVEELK
eukprot:TRINITY_DN1317_c0_g3_i1.p1 TRINITY_DN1317_c0_g3~~TRINITY_DN1317_c0_g3_i1.p1  ORF type:complete len:317 (-),score=94.13 TRINITY_DN1317_c0_g3_i1:17-886(-)